MSKFQFIPLFYFSNIRQNQYDFSIFFNSIGRYLSDPIIFFSY